MRNARRHTDAGDEAELVTRAQAGDETAFEALVARYRRFAFAICLRLLADVASAEDAAQDSFIAAWRRLQTGRPLRFNPGDSVEHGSH
jgi:RNA polymerase sigma-70 factor (ECF subfamily)